MSRHIWKYAAGVVLALALLAPAARAAKTTAATSSGNWNAAIWNNGAPEAGDTVTINSGVSVTLTNATPALAAFTNWGTLVFTNWNTSLQAVDVSLKAGRVTHALCDTNAAPGVINRIHFICSNLTVDTAAQIDAYGVGYRGAQYVVGQNTTGQGPAPGRGDGGTTVGAGHGGAGGYGSGTYGSPSEPETPGSGGGYTGSYNQWYGYHGGNGGGVVRIQASGAVVVDGLVRADGAYINAIPFGGRNSGGAGGSVYITCSTFGGSGLIDARGGNGGSYDAGGGGGRVAVVFDPAAQSNAPASGVKFNVDGGEGRNVYGTYAGGYGTLWVSDGTVLPTAWTNNDAAIHVVNWKLNTLSVVGTGTVSCVVELRQSGGTLAATNLVVSKATLSLASGWSVALQGDLSLSNGAALRIPAAATNGTAPAYGAVLGVTGTVRLAANAWLYPVSDSTNGGSVYMALNNLTADATSGINADGLGFRGGNAGQNMNGFGPGGGRTASNGCGGGGYGGAGAGGQGGGAGSAYGGPSGPPQPGSGGGNNNQATDTAGNGGGLIWIDARGDVTLDGALRANGTHLVNPGGWRAGGGSGGGVFLACRSLTGSGAISANGGWGRNAGGGGGGGRIVLTVDPVAQSNAAPYAITFSASGGPGIYAAGATGTLSVNDSQLLTGTWPGAATVYGVQSWAVPSLAVTGGALTFADAGAVLGVSGDALIRNGSLNATSARITIGGSVALGTNASLTLSSAAGVAPTLDIGGSLAMTNSTLSVYAAATNGAPPGYGGRVSVGGAWTVASNSWIYPYSESTNGGSLFFEAGSLTVGTGCGFNANGLGFRGGALGSASTNGWGPGRGTGQVLGGNGAGGAGYGGKGGNGYDGWGGGVVYGSALEPKLPGSGGGTTSATGAPGGNGGGLIWIEVAKDAVIDGLLTANGTYAVSNTNWRAGGGSGGGILLKARTVGGAGQLSAKGGFPAYAGGGGGGGRIAVWCSVSNYVGSASVTGAGAWPGYNATAGANGSVVWKHIPPPGTVLLLR